MDNLDVHDLAPHEIAEMRIELPKVPYEFRGKMERLLDVYEDFGGRSVSEVDAAFEKAEEHAGCEETLKEKNEEIEQGEKEYAQLQKARGEMRNAIEDALAHLQEKPVNIKKAIELLEGAL